MPEPVITKSSDINCGGLGNELEYLREVSKYYTQSFDLDIAEGENLDNLITAFLDLPRRNRAEPDATYRARYRAIANAKVNSKRTTKWAIIDAITEFGILKENIQIVEPSGTTQYFEVRIEGIVDYDDAIFIGSVDSGFLDVGFVGGSGVGGIISFLGNIIDRIKAAGVDYDILFIMQDRFTKTVSMTIGAVQKYQTVIAVIKAASTITKTVGAVVTV